MVGFCHCICDNGRNGHRRGTINGGVLGSGVGMEYKDNDIGILIDRSLRELLLLGL